jgi:RNA polymerase-binding transcription factor DksA
MGPVSDTTGSQTNGTAIDLDRIEQDLADVDIALGRLEDGTYWTCEVTGAEIPAEKLAENPTLRRSV